MKFLFHCFLNKLNPSVIISVGHSNEAEYSIIRFVPNIYKALKKLIICINVRGIISFNRMWLNIIKYLKSDNMIV